MQYLRCCFEGVELLNCSSKLDCWVCSLKTIEMSRMPLALMNWSTTFNGGRAKSVQGDVSKTDDIDNLFTETVNHFGAVDILVNNAGVYQWGPIEEVMEDGFYHQFGINVLGPLLASKAAVRYTLQN
jgi:NAD(P)-dependent dehydrogenase (short-subunit alcohol dehydrogenase family)